MDFDFIALLLQYKYLLIIPLAIIEGPILAMVCGFFIQTDFFSFWPIFVILMLGDLISDIYWYAIGYYGGRRLILKYGRFFSVNEKTLEVTERIYHRHYHWILLLSKVTMGFGFAVAIVATAGIVRVPFRKYMILNIIGQPIWTGMLLGIGYFLGNYLYRVQNGFELISVIALIIITFAGLFGLSRYVRTKLTNKYSS